jgi:hypothetical protein
MLAERKHKDMKKRFFIENFLFFLYMLPRRNTAPKNMVEQATSRRRSAQPWRVVRHLNYFCAGGALIGGIRLPAVAGWSNASGDPHETLI